MDEQQPVAPPMPPAAPPTPPDLAMAPVPMNAAAPPDAAPPSAWAPPPVAAPAPEPTAAPAWIAPASAAGWVAPSAEPPRGHVTGLAKLGALILLLFGTLWTLAGVGLIAAGGAIKTSIEFERVPRPWRLRLGRADRRRDRGRDLRDHRDPDRHLRLARQRLRAGDRDPLRPGLRAWRALRRPHCTERRHDRHQLHRDRRRRPRGDRGALPVCRPDLHRPLPEPNLAGWAGSTWPGRREMAPMLIGGTLDRELRRPSRSTGRMGR